MDDFNPLDISILTKALDIIEKKCSSSSYCSDGGKKHGIAFYKGESYVCGGDGNTREESILKAVLEYIKKLNNETITGFYNRT